jgi:uncharacterized membrane protein YbhN (UPF0104 family)
VTATTRRRLGQLVVLVTLVLLALLARKIDWRQVLQTLGAMRATTLLMAGAAACAGHVVYATFDLLGKRYTQHPLPARQTMPVTFVCYVFNLNLGAWLGSIALRYRLYSRLGLEPAVITRILSLSLMTNWLGYLALGGIVFATGQVHLGGEWALSTFGLRVVGAILLAVAGAYLAVCAFSRRRLLRVRGREIALPSWRLALLQLLLGACSWSLMALVIYLLLAGLLGNGALEYPTVLGTLLVSAIAGVASHVPAGLGVIEAVFLGLLGARVPQESLLAALIGYRSLYFLAPLLIATVVFGLFEARASRLARAV